MDVLHTAFSVSDLEQTKAFYLDHLGLETSRVVEDGDATMHFVKGASETELQFNYDPEGGAVDPGDFDHVAIEVDDTDAMVEQIVEETDGALREGPMDDGDSRIAFVEDPDGYGIELIS
jgi:lactoylglutathione lyase